MFRVSFMVEDRKLSEVLRLLSGKVVNMEPPMPVTLDEQVIVHNRATAEGGSRAHGMNWSKFQLPKAGTKFNGEDLKKWLVKAGYAEGSIYHAHTKLKELGRIELVEARRGLPGGNIYKVI